LFAIVILARFVVDMRTGITLPRLSTGRPTATGTGLPGDRASAVRDVPRETPERPCRSSSCATPRTPCGSARTSARARLARGRDRLCRPRRATRADPQWHDFNLAYIWAINFFVIDRQGITLTPEVAARRVPWAEVQAVTLEPTGWGATAVTLWPADRKRLRLHAPTRAFTWENPRLEEEWRTIGDWWVAHRGTDWQPGYRGSAPAQVAGGAAGA
jgi:hypothetical protein